MSEATKVKRKPMKTKAALDAADLPPGLDALLDQRQVMSALRVKYSYLDKLRKSGVFPAPDAVVGIRPRWRVSTFNRFVAGWSGSLG